MTRIQGSRDSKRGKKGITPVVGTILLLASTIILGLAVGAYSFGLMGSNVKTIQLNNATLFGGPLPASPTCVTGNSAYMTLVLNNPGASTNITRITVTGNSLNSSVAAYYLSNSGVCTQVGPSSTQPVISNGTTISYTTSSSAAPSLGAGAITSLTLYFGVSTGSSLATAQTFSYVIYFANGQSISGALLAQ